MKTYTLLIDGKDMDTGAYEYFPYADKMITDFRSTYKVIMDLKKGIVVPDVDKYIFARYCVAAENTNQQAIESAYRASQKFRYFPVRVRLKIMHDIHDKLLERKKELVNLLVIEGHPRRLAEWEVDGMLKGLRPESMSRYKDELWTEVGRAKNETMYVVRKPDGVVCVVPPKNAPCSNSFLASAALLGGNTIVVKPPLHSPLSTIYVWKEIGWKVAQENGAPPGTINIVTGNAKKISDEWLISPHVNDIIYFGTSEHGLEIGNRIYAAGKKPILELSGNDIMMVWKDVDIDKASSALQDAFLGSQQICMVPKAALIHQDIYEHFLESFAEKVKKLKVGLPSDSETCLTPVVKIKEFYEFLNDALTKGARLVCGGERVDSTGKPNDKGIYITPAILEVECDDKAMEMKCVIKEENFFPLLPLVRVRGCSDMEIFNKMIEVTNSNEYGLRTSVWVRSSFFTRRFIRYINNTGLLRINSRHVDFSLFLATHGGTGKTGGPYGEMNYVWQKTTHLQGISLTREKIPGKIK